MSIHKLNGAAVKKKNFIRAALDRVTYQKLLPLLLFTLQRTQKRDFLLTKLANLTKTMMPISMPFLWQARVEK